ncbi:MAG: hypothetical protein KI790_12495 [Cyclobacteriaceae bacterium]|nr:hypothetical protein [Cyclobacteriaceae bacterium HetDA_MAG_MS6]
MFKLRLIQVLIPLLFLLQTYLRTSAQPIRPPVGTDARTMSLTAIGNFGIIRKAVLTFPHIYTQVLTSKDLRITTSTNLFIL